jgi:hypothetical protein
MSVVKPTVSQEVRAATDRLNKLISGFYFGNGTFSSSNISAVNSGVKMNMLHGKRKLTETAKVAVQAYLDSMKDPPVREHTYPPHMMPSVAEDHYSLVGTHLTSVAAWPFTLFL